MKILKIPPTIEKISYFCRMNGLKTIIYTKSAELPALSDDNFFHSRRLFSICEQTPRQKPLMVVVSDASGRVVSHLLGVIRVRTTLLPPFLLIHCRVMGEGVYAESEYPKEELFGEMLGALSKAVNGRTLFIEVSHLSQKMVGYRQFRQQQFFPVHWMSIHNSLHSRAPEERLTEKMQKRIATATARGVTTEAVSTEKDFKAFSKLLRKHNLLKPKRYIPDDMFFRKLMESGDGRLFVTKFRERVIGCSACVYSGGNAYLWYSAFRRKTYRPLYPDVMTIWHAIKHAHENGYQHIVFMDVGLPFSKNLFREFILKFGGKPTSTYRWFRISVKWMNALAAWIYRE